MGQLTTKLIFSLDLNVCSDTHVFYMFNTGGVIISKRKLDNRKADSHVINEKITAPVVLVIGPNGEQVGEKSRADALTIAEAAGYDLVLVAPNSKPPVCRIMDFGKFRYEQQRKTKESKKNSKTVQLKEIRLTPVTDIHDIETKARNGRKFLEKGHKLKVSVFFRGRQMQHKDLGEQVLSTFLTYVEDLCEVEKKPIMEGRYMSMYLAPKK